MLKNLSEQTASRAEMHHYIFAGTDELDADTARAAMMTKRCKDLDDAPESVLR